MWNPPRLLKVAPGRPAYNIPVFCDQVRADTIKLSAKGTWRHSILSVTPGFPETRCARNSIHSKRCVHRPRMSELGQKRTCRYPSADVRHWAESGHDPTVHVGLRARVPILRRRRAQRPARGRNGVSRGVDPRSARPQGHRPRAAGHRRTDGMRQFRRRAAG